MSKSTIGKSMKGYRPSQTTTTADLKGLLASLSGQGLAFDNVTITTATIYGGSMDDVEIGAIQPSNATFTNVTVGDDVGNGGVLVAYGNTIGDYVRWDPSTAKVNVAGGLVVRDPSTLGNIVIAGNNISAVNKDGSINLIPNSPTAAVNVSGSLVQTAPGVVSFNNATDFSVVSAQGANITGATSASLVSTNGPTLVSSGGSSVSVSAASSVDVSAASSVSISAAAGPLTATSGTNMVLDAGKGVSITAHDGPLNLLSNATVQFRVDVPLTFLNDVDPPPVRGPLAPQIVATSTDAFKFSASQFIFDTPAPIMLPQGGGIAFGVDGLHPGGTASIKEDAISQDFKISALRDLILNAVRDVVVPNGVPLVFSDPNNASVTQRISKTSEGLVIESTPPTPIILKGNVSLPAGYTFGIGGNILQTTASGGLSVTSPQEITMQSTKDISIGSTGGNLSFASAGAIKFPDDVMLQVGDTPDTGFIAHKGQLHINTGADLVLQPQSGKIVANAISLSLPDRSEISFGGTAAVSTLGDGGNLTLQSDNASVLLQAVKGSVGITASAEVSVTSGSTVKVSGTQGIAMTANENNVSIGAASGGVILNAQRVIANGEQGVALSSKFGPVLVTGSTDVNVSTQKGKVTIDGATGIAVKASGGDVNVSSIQGAVALNAISGLTASVLNGNIDLTAVEGSVHVTSKGQLALSSTEGKVAVTSATGVTVAATSGDISMGAALGSVSFASNSDIRLAAQRNVSISARGDASINTDGKLDMTSTGNLSFSTQGDLDLKSKGYIDVAAQQSVDLSAQGHLSLISQRDATLTSALEKVQVSSAKNLDLVSSGASVTLSAPQGDAKVTAKGIALESSTSGVFITAHQSDVAITAEAGSVLSRGQDIKLTATSGSISATSNSSYDVNTRTNITLTSATGGVNVSALTGNVGVNADTGNINIHTNQGDVALSTGSGNAQVAGKDISLNASEKVAVPLGIPIFLGGNSNIYESAVDGKLHITDPEGVVIDKNVTINGSFTVVGESEHIFATVTTFHDGLLSLAPDATATDRSDRGVEFLYHDSTGAAKWGMMGFSQQDYRFHLVLDGTNTNETYAINRQGDLQLGSLFATNDISGPKVVTQWVSSGGSNQNVKIDGKIISLTPAERVLIPGNVPVQIGSSALTDGTTGLVVDSQSLQIARGILAVGQTSLNTDLSTGSFSVNPSPSTASISLNGPVTIPQVLNFGTSATKATVALSNGKDLLVTSAGQFTASSADTLRLSSTTNVALSSATDTTVSSFGGSVNLTGQKTVSLGAGDGVAITTTGYFTTNSSTSQIQTRDTLSLISGGNANITSSASIVASSTGATSIASGTTLSLSSSALLSLASQVKVAIASSDVSLASTRDVSMTAGNTATVNSSGLLSLASSSAVAVSSQGTVGLSGFALVSISSQQQVSVSSLQKVAIHSDAELGLSSNGTTIVSAVGSLALSSQDAVSINSRQTATLASAQSVNVTADKALTLQSSTSTTLTSAGNISANSGAVATVSGGTSVGISSPGTVGLVAGDACNISGTSAVKLGSSDAISLASKTLSLKTSDSAVIQTGGNLTTTVTGNTDMSAQGSTTLTSGQQMRFVSQATVAVQASTGATLSSLTQDVTLRADQGSILLQSSTFLGPGKTLNFSQVSMSSQSDGVLTLSNNSSATASVDLSIHGRISGNCDWNGNPIGMSYGGTGHLNPWLPRSIVFVDPSGNLRDKPNELCWDPNIQSIGIRTPLTTAEAAISVGYGHVDLQGENSFIRYYSSGRLSWSNGAVRAASSHSTYQVTRYSSTSGAVPVFIANENGQVGFGVNAETMVSLSSGAGLVQVGGDISFGLAVGTASLRWDGDTFVTGDVANGVILISGRMKTIIRSRLTCENGVQWGDDGFLTMTGDVTKQTLTVSAPSRVYLTSPHVIHSARICFAHRIADDGCTTYFETQARGDGNGRDLTFINTDGDILLAPKSSVTLAGNSNLSFPGVGTIGTGGGGVLAISSVQGTVLSPGNSGLVSIANQGRIAVQGATASTSTSLGIDTDGNFSVQTSSGVGIKLATQSSVSVPANVPLVFGSDPSRRISSDGDSLLIQSPDLITLSSNNVVVTGNFVVKKTSTFTVESETDFESGVINLGGGQLGKIVNLASGPSTGQTTVTLNGPHELVPGDKISISDTIPDVDGNYTVNSVPSFNQLVIDKTFPGIPAGATVQGTVRSSLTANLNADVGVVVNWHTGAVSGTAGAQTGFFGFDRSTGRFTFIPNAARNNDTFSGAPGDLQIGDIYSSSITSTGTITGQHLSVADLISPLDTGSQQVKGSNFVIMGGSIDGTPIGSQQPSQGKFTYLDVTDGFMVHNASLVANLNADMLDGRHAADFLLRDGTASLTADWNAGPYVITGGGIAATDLAETAVPFVGANGRLVTDATVLAVKDGIFTPQKVSGFTSTGAINLNGNVITDGVLNQVVMSDSTMNNSVITTSNITVPTGYTLDVSGGTVVFADRQISGNVISGGVAQVDITGNADTVRDGVYGRNFAEDNTILKADTAGNPVSLVVPEATFVGRLPGADTQIQALSQDDAMGMLNAVSRDAFYSDNSLLKADTAGAPVAMEVPINTIVGRTASGSIHPLTPQEARDVLNVEPITTAAIFREGALLRSGRSAEYPEGGTMTGLLLTSSERFHIATGQNPRTLNVDVETTYILCDYLRTGGRVARCKLGAGYADGHRKLIIMSNLAEYAFLQISCNIIAGGTPDPCGFIFYLAGQSAMLQWDAYASKWLIIGGSGAQVVTPDDLSEADDFLDFLAAKRNR